MMPRPVIVMQIMERQENCWLIQSHIPRHIFFKVARKQGIVQADHPAENHAADYPQQAVVTSQNMRDSHMEQLLVVPIGF